METRDTAKQFSLTLNRMFDAPRNAVFRAWTETEEIEKWWAPDGFSEPSAEVDLRVGGKYRLGFRNPKGEWIHITGS